DAFMYQNVASGTNTSNEVIGHIGTQTPSHQQVNRARLTAFGKVHCRLAGGVSGPDHGDILRIVKQRFHTGAGVMDARRLKSFSAFDAELPPANSRGGQDSAGAQLRSAV